MSVSRRSVRGLQEIRTVSGMVDQTFHPHRAYLRIGCLELEKARRGKERESAMRRVSLIDARFQEIDAEEGALLKRIAERDRELSGAGSRAEEQPGTSRPPKGGFRIKY